MPSSLWLCVYPIVYRDSFVYVHWHRPLEGHAHTERTRLTGISPTVAGLLGWMDGWNAHMTVAVVIGLELCCVEDQDESHFISLL